MDKARVVLWLCALTGLLALLAGTLRLWQHSNVFYTFFDFAVGAFFLLLAWRQLQAVRRR